MRPATRPMMRTGKPSAVQSPRARAVFPLAGLEEPGSLGAGDSRKTSKSSRCVRRRFDFADPVIRTPQWRPS